jgi:Caspase domain
MESSQKTTYTVTYYTQQAILIGCTSPTFDKALINVRRMRNFLRDKRGYECQMIENPVSENEIQAAISEAIGNMNWSYRSANLMIYFSGEAKRYKVDGSNNYGVKCTLNETQTTVDLKKIIQDID